MGNTTLTKYVDSINKHSAWYLVYACYTVKTNHNYHLLLTNTTDRNYFWIKYEYVKSTKRIYFVYKYIIYIDIFTYNILYVYV